MAVRKYTLTDEHRAQLPAWRDRWIANAMSTKPMDDADRAAMVEAVEGLYRAAKLEPPPRSRIVFVPSPFVAVFAGSFAAHIWATMDATWDATRDATWDATRDATWDATQAATWDATRAATQAATWDATQAATWDATQAATWDATRDATLAATLDATWDATRAATLDATWHRDCVAGFVFAAKSIGPAQDLLAAASKFSTMYAGGNQWSAGVDFISFFRHVAKLPIDYSRWHHYEQAAIHGGPRMMHAKFCIISDRPEILTVDAQNRPHNERGPFCRWRDGTALYAWHGVRVPWTWIEDRASLAPQTALTWRNIEQRRAACEIVGWERILRELSAKVIDTDDDPMIGELVEVEIPDVGRERFLRVVCGTGRKFALPVPPDMPTALAANAWTFDLDGDTLRKLETRT